MPEAPPLDIADIAAFALMPLRRHYAACLRCRVRVTPPLALPPLMLRAAAVLRLRCCYGRLRPIRRCFR